MGRTHSVIAIVAKVPRLAGHEQSFLSILKQHDKYPGSDHK